jgi:uncharacterized repeat protein (TIGR03943 family)
MNTTWNRTRLATAGALAIWALMFWYLLIADRTPYYLSSRTTWLAPVGAIGLTLAALGLIGAARTHDHPQRVTKRTLRNLAILVLPAIALLVLPPPTLGSFAAGRRTSSIKGAYVEVSGRDISKGDLSLTDIFGLRYIGELNLLRKRAGDTSSFTGFITRRSDDRADEFTLNRFMISCCPGDAVLTSVRVVGAPPGQFQQDDWMRVTGKIYPLGKEIIVDASDVQKVPKPKHPYLTP